jgi:cytochrome c2
MIRKSVLWILLLLAATLLAGTPVLAGGWAVITLDNLPGEIIPGQPVTIGFTVLQHGEHPMEGLDPVITLSQTGTGERLTFTAVLGDGPGHYQATLNIPSEGRWEWTIQAFSMNQEMPPLTVGPAPLASQGSPGTSLNLPMATGSLGVVLTLAALWILLRKRARWAFALVLAGLLVSSLGFLSAAAGSSPPESNEAQDSSLEAIGQQLFLAKGCITCHNHNEVRRDGDTIYVDVGPDLSSFSADPDYLRRWLQDPASIRPETLMPDLDLEEGEIQALIAFLNAK